jgi:hypothetical protein
LNARQPGHVFHHIVGASPCGDFLGHYLFKTSQRDLPQRARLGEITIQFAEGLLDPLASKFCIRLLNQPAMNDTIGVDHDTGRSRRPLVVSSAAATKAPPQTTATAATTKPTTPKTSTKLSERQGRQGEEHCHKGNETQRGDRSQAHFGPQMAKAGSSVFRRKARLLQVRGSNQAGAGGTPPAAGGGDFPSS